MQYGLRRFFAIPPKNILKLKEDSCLDAVGTAGQLQWLEIASLAYPREVLSECFF